MNWGIAQHRRRKGINDQKMLFEPAATDYVTPTLSFLGVVVTSLGTLLVKHYLDKKKNADDDLKVEKPDLKFELLFTLSEINELNQRVYDLEERTRMDRFLILEAWNGERKPQKATVLHEKYRNRISFIASLVYRNVPLDADYQQMLEDAEKFGVVAMETSTMNEKAELRSFYEIENVKFCRLYYLFSFQVSKQRRVVVYCTIATKDEKDFSKIEIAHIDMFIAYLKEIFLASIQRLPKKKKGDEMKDE